MKKYLLSVAGAIVVLSLALVCLTGKLGYTQSKMIQIKGSDTMINIGQAWAAAFTKKTNIRVAVIGGGSSTGFAALINNTCDVAEASRGIKPEETVKARNANVQPNEITVAWDGISVIVNPKNPVKKLTMDQLADVFSGKITNWKALGGQDGNIVLFTRDTASGTFAFFKEHVIQKNGQNKDEYATDAHMLQSNQQIYDEVSRNPRAIGYVGLGYAKNQVVSVMVAAGSSTKYVKPSVANVKNKSYPISRPMFWYTNGKPQGEVKKLVDFVFSAEGQKIVRDLDFVPVK